MKNGLGFSIATAGACRYAAATVIGLLASLVLSRGSSKEKELLGRIARGDREAFRRLYEAQSAKALGIALRILGDRGEAEDVLQEVFVEVWRRAADYDAARGTTSAWIATMARTRAIDRLRSRGSAARTVAGASVEPEPVRQNAPLELAEQRQARERVEQALGALPVEQRSVIELAYFEGLTQREIAERTGEPLGTIKTRVRLAMEKLASLLEGLATPS